MKKKIIYIDKALLTLLTNSTDWNQTLSTFDFSRLFDIVNATSNDTYEYDECQDNCLGFIQGWAVDYGKNYHVYISLAVCIFGTISNLLNIMVLTRKDMASAPINRILTALAVADILIMVEYMPFSYYYYIELPDKLNFPYLGAMYILFHTHFTQILHTVSICLTLTLAIWRYLAIGYPNQTQIFCSERRCTMGIILSFLLPVLLCTPMYLTFKIGTTIITEDKKYTLFVIELSDIAKRNNYLVFNFWLYAVIIKLLPCCILTFLSMWLIRTLFVAKNRKQLLKNYDACPAIEGKDKSKSKLERRTRRTTKMLVAVLLLFLTTEFPQGMFGLVIGMKGKCMFLKCYQYFGELMDILALLNGSITFILYCWMNRMFRTTFGQLFRSKIMARWMPSGNSDIYTTSNISDATKL